MKQTLPPNIDSLFVHCHLATMKDNALSPIRDAALAVTGRTISWIGKEADLPRPLPPCNQVIDCRGGWLLPGFVDCHTHLVWAGSRSNEFEMRLKGTSYEDILAGGGGILSTVNATRKASLKELLEVSAKRARAFLEQGTTTLEIKSGYGLDLETELKILEVAAALRNQFPLHIEATFLGAHALPKAFKGNPDGYIDLVTRTMLPAVKAQGIATAVDVFCEQIAFSREQTRKVFEAATALGLRVKLHAEQLSDSGGAALAAEFKALSCDHLEYLSLSGAEKLAENGVTAVLVPGAFYFLKEKQVPPVETLRKLKIPMAVSTDLNPGTSPIHSMPLILNMACVLFGLTCEEALSGATLNGARALGLAGSKGSLETGKDADLVLWDIETPQDLCYLAGLVPLELSMIQGNLYINRL